MGARRKRKRQCSRTLTTLYRPLESTVKKAGTRARWKSQARGKHHHRHRTWASLAWLFVAIMVNILITSVNCDTNLQPTRSHSARGDQPEKVAALASRLEQWFSCRRSAGSLEGFEGVGSVCGPHFDGHLCWPATGIGERAQLACPNLSRLSGELEVPVVIDELTGNEPKPANSRSIIQHVNKPVKFAYRNCQLLNGSQGLENLMLENRSSDAIPRAQWQPEASYVECKDKAQEGGHFDPSDKWINLDQEPDKQLYVSLLDQLDRIEGAIDPYSDPDLQEQWRLCIGNIIHQQQAQSSMLEPHGDLWCPIIFDGWRCWPSTRAGETAYVGCPRNQPGFSVERKAHKICTPNGTWYRHPMTNRYWSNYTTCVDTVDLAFRTKILNLYVIGNLISLVALSASLIIFISFKSLSCTRVTIHKNLFLSFITNNLMWIIWYTYVVNDANLLQSNPIECQFWHILLHYFLVSNYFWMFCEGLYLHTLLVVAFVSEDKILKWFYLLGWLTPVPITVAYAYNRSYDEYYTNFCWMEESPYNLILMAPIGLSLLLNLVFLINIVRVLVTKLRANNLPDTHQTRKAVRATLILIPLLGLHYILTPFRPEAKSEWEVIYESVAAVCTSFQGLCVAMLFCFCNGEVITVVEKKIKDIFNLSQWRTDGQMRSRSNTTAGIGLAANSSNNLRFVISTSNNGHLAQSDADNTLNGITNSAISERVSQYNHHQIKSHSNSSSLLTTLEASPVLDSKQERDALQATTDNKPNVVSLDSTISSNEPNSIIEVEDSQTASLLRNRALYDNLTTTSFTLA